MMEEKEFIVPDKLDDLCSVSDNNHYVVYDVMTIRDIAEKICEIKGRDNFADDNDEFIFKHFDVFYSMLKYFEDMDLKIKHEAFAILIEVGENLVNTELPSILESIGEDGENNFLTDDINYKYRNMIKMVFYLLCQFTEAFECEIMKPSVMIVTTTKKGRKKKNESSESSKNDKWESMRNKFIYLMINLFKLPINRLWVPPVMEYQFINISTLIFFKILENPSACVTKSQKGSDSLEVIFEFLGQNLKSHDLDLAYSIKILQLIEDHAHLPVIMAKAVNVFIAKHGKKSILVELLKEFGCFNTDEIGTKETAVKHQISLFFTELTKHCPDDVLSVIDLLLPTLEEECHILRNCVLSIIAELIIRISEKESDGGAEELVKDRLISILMDHVLDVNAFVRSRVLQIIKHLVDENALSLYNQLAFAQRISGRLKDKTSLVRKNCIEFLKSFLIKNPFAAQLPIKELQDSFLRESDKLKVMTVPVPSNNSGIDEATSINVDEEGNKDEEVPCNNEEVLNVNNVEKDSENNYINEREKLVLKSQKLPSYSEEANERDKQCILVEYLKLTVQSAELIINSMPIVCELLKSTVVTDILTAVEYITSAFQLGLKEAVSGIKEMMRLIFSNDPVVKNAVVAAYRKLYLTKVDESERDKEGKNRIENAELIAKNLMLFLHGATENEVFAIEEFVKEFTKNGDITDDVIETLWKEFESLNDKEGTKNYSSILLLSMASSVDPNVILRNISRLISVGLGQGAETDFMLVKETCSALMKINNSCKDPQRPEKLKVKQFRLHRSNTLFMRLSVLLAQGFDRIDDNRFCPMAEKALNVIFKLADCPEKICMVIIQGLAKRIKCHLNIEERGGNHSQYANIKAAMYVRFIFLCGHAILCYLTYLENDVIAEMKRREYLKEEVMEKRKHNKPNIFQSLPGNEMAHNETDMEFEGAEAEDEILFFISKVLDEDILSTENFFGVIYQFIVNTCKVTLKHFDPSISAAASLSLAKFMCVSSLSCEENMQLMMTILEKSPQAAIRSNIMISIGDMMSRFPNVVQPWTVNIFKRLQDDSCSVRRNALIILTHLILHDMIKIKGSISDVALCMVDDTEEIVIICKYLFKELSKKKNALYNLLPDLISGLSDINKDVSLEKFEIIMKHVFSYIEKEKEVEGLVEKLCVRLKDSRSSCQVHKIMFSLTLFNISEKCFQKLLEHKDSFKSKMDDETSVKFMKEIIASAKKHSVKLEEDINTFTNSIGLNLCEKS